MLIFCNPLETSGLKWSEPRLENGKSLRDTQILQYTTENRHHKITTSHKPGPCFAGDAFSGPNSNNTWEPLGAGGADTAEYPDSLDWYPM